MLLRTTKVLQQHFFIPAKSEITVLPGLFAVYSCTDNQYSDQYIKGHLSCAVVGYQTGCQRGKDRGGTHDGFVDRRIAAAFGVVCQSVVSEIKTEHPGKDPEQGSCTPCRKTGAAQRQHRQRHAGTCSAEQPSPWFEGETLYFETAQRHQCLHNADQREHDSL